MSINPATSKAYTKVSFGPGGINAQVNIQSFTLIQGGGQHDIGILTVRADVPTQPYYQTGTPVHVLYGWDPYEIEDFYGYVNHIDAPYDWRQYNLSEVTFDVILIGTSFLLKEAVTRIWRDMQPSQIVATIAGNNALATVTEHSDAAVPQLTNPGKSQWWFLRMLASRLGWMLSCNKSQLRFLSYDQALKLGAGTLPVFYGRGKDGSGQPQTLSHFRVMQGDAIPDEDGDLRLTQVVANGMNLVTGSIYQINDTSTRSIMGTTSPTPLFHSYLDAVTDDVQSAKTLISGSSQESRFHIRATATVNGEVNVSQGMPVLLLGLDAQSNGVWLVLEVTHKLSYNSYTMDLVLGRDSLGDNKARPRSGNQVVWSKNDPYGLGPNQAPPPTLLVNGQWRAAFRQDLVAS